MQQTTPMSVLGTARSLHWGSQQVVGAKRELASDFSVPSHNCVTKGPVSVVDAEGRLHLALSVAQVLPRLCICKPSQVWLQVWSVSDLWLR